MKPQTAWMKIHAIDPDGEWAYFTDKEPTSKFSEPMRQVTILPTEVWQKVKKHIRHDQDCLSIKDLGDCTCGLDNDLESGI